MSQQSLILIGGPTASGKSALAMRIARERKGNIINADAMQVYAGLPLLTAQPEPTDKADIPHLLYEITDPGVASSAGKWLFLARTAIQQTLSEGRTPILVGGTGLYFEALRGGLANIPPIPEEVRAQAERLYLEWGEEKFRAELTKRDSVSAARIARNDRQRLVRAYEVITHTGKSLEEWHKEEEELAEQFSANYHLLMPPRDELYTACDQRFVSMIERGAIEEVKKLVARDLPPSLPAMKILGVREIAAYQSPANDAQLCQETNDLVQESVAAVKSSTALPWLTDQLCAKPERVLSKGW